MVRTYMNEKLIPNIYNDPFGDEPRSGDYEYQWTQDGCVAASLHPQTELCKSY